MKLGNDNLQKWRRSFIRCRKHCGGRATGIALTLLGVVLVGSVSVQAAPLLEEAFAYPAGTTLAANLPWAGNAGGSLQVQAGSLTLPNLQ
ncbi:MAG TPA: hypothetical protein VL527_10275, partial [Dongiaceae bacterium]|nr:hypothetical protein [Dongiaceae bacterium]